MSEEPMDSWTKHVLIGFSKSKSSVLGVVSSGFTLFVAEFVLVCLGTLAG